MPNREKMCAKRTMIRICRRDSFVLLLDMPKEVSARLAQAHQKIDAANAADPAELVYGQRMSEWLARLYPDASEPLCLAVRAQHLLRFKVPRSSYPEGRIGYLKWRTDLHKFHAEEAGKILRECGYEDTVISRVSALIKKEKLKADPEAQALEDATCLAFLELEFEDFAAKHEDEKVVSILLKTWGKMSELGRNAGLEAAKKLSQKSQALIARALAS